MEAIEGAETAAELDPDAAADTSETGSGEPSSETAPDEVGTVDEVEPDASADEAEERAEA